MAPRAALVFVALAGCVELGSFPCAEDAQCNAGACVEGFCAHPDDTCPSGQRWSGQAGGFAHQCVPEPQPATGTDTDTDTDTDGDALGDVPPYDCGIVFDQPADALRLSEFGATCDGADDAGAVAAALAALPDGGTLVIDCLASIGDGGVVLAGKANVRVVGQDGGGFVALGSGGSMVGGVGPFTVAVRNCTACVVENLALRGALGVELSEDVTLKDNRVDGAGLGPSAGALHSASNVRPRIVCNEITDVDAVGIWSGGDGVEDTRPTIAFNTVRRASSTGINGRFSGGAVVGNVIEEVAGNCIARGQWTDTTARGVIEENQAIRCGAGGLVVVDAIDLTVRGNVVDGPGQGGIFASGAASTRFAWNTVLDVAGPGLHLLGATGGVVEHGEFLDTRAGAMRRSEHGVLLEDVTGLVVRNNLAVNQTVAGYATGPVEDVEIYGNRGQGNEPFDLVVAGGATSTACASDNDFPAGVEADIDLDACADVLASTPRIATDALPEAQVGQPFEVALAAEGGASPYTFTAVSGTVPHGLVLGADGVLSGTPTRPGLYTLTVYADDDRSPAQSARRVLDMVVLP